MSKDLLMQYTNVCLFFIAILSYPVFGLEGLVVILVSLGVAVGCDVLLGKLMGSSNMMSAITFGFIVGLSYSLGQPLMALESNPTVAGGLELFAYPAMISALGLVVFKRLAGKAGRKYVNPAAISKLIILGLLFLPMISNVSALLPSDHELSLNLQNPMDPATVSGLFTCYTDPNGIMMGTQPQFTTMNMDGTLVEPLLDVTYTMLVAKYHGWIGGFSSIIVIIFGLALLYFAKDYFKWRITVTYLIVTAILSLIFGFMFGGDIIVRMLFHLFAGSSIFMAFFMATDPATTPITRTGQLIFGIGLAVITMLVQVYANFLGGSIVALVIMNLTCPLLDRIGVPKARSERVACARLPKAKKLGKLPTTQCIRCGRCLYVCSGRLPTISIKEAADKGDWDRVKKLGVEYCQQCGTCSFVCPARIDLKAAMLEAKTKVTAA
jgi:electron transport complex protein RnfD